MIYKNPNIETLGLYDLLSEITYGHSDNIDLLKLEQFI